MIRGIDREIAKLPSCEQPGNYRPSVWDEQTTEQIKDMSAFFTPQIKEFDVWNRYP